MERPQDISEIELLKANELRSDYKARFWVGMDYYLEGNQPFAQHNHFSLYANDTETKICRYTETKYEFIYNQNGRYLVFKSKKEPSVEFTCSSLKCPPSK